MVPTHQTFKTQYLSREDQTYACRRFNKSSGVVLVFSIHFRGSMDLCDTLLINPLSETHPVILSSNTSVSQSNSTVEEADEGIVKHAVDRLAVINAKVMDQLGFSVGSQVARMAALKAPEIPIRRLIITDSGLSGGGEGFINRSVK